MSNRVSYRNYYGTRCVYNNIELPVFLKLSEVEKVLKALEEAIDRDGQVTVAKFYELTGGQILDDDSKFGWKNLVGCQVCKCRYGYELQMPRAVELNVNPVEAAYEVLCRAATVDDENEYVEAVGEAIDILSKTL